ncbi:MAG: cyclic nucleotide-binding domain-containing protein [Cyanobacteriota bacterium]|nr:cyclic nucleotide-binding domain-containing protein [Cyanobacteriota bacterium]
MLKQILKQRLRLAGEQGSRLTHLLFLAVSMMAFSVVALTVASSLFLSRVGATYLPLSYVLMGLISLPAYTWLSQVVDRYSRVLLCQIFLIVGTILAVVLRGLLELDATWTYYALHVGSYFQWILVPEVLFPSLVSDYFTSLDWKRYAPYLKMAMAVGGLLGGGLTALLAGKISPENLLWILPGLYAIALFQLTYFDARQKPLAGSPTPDDTSEEFNWTTLPALLHNYPIIFFLASSTFLYILLYSIAEFEYLSIYAHTFADKQQLTRFLGLMRVANNILPFFILYLVTRPLIARLGVSRMNLVYPLTTIASFTSLATHLNLPAAIACNFNADGLDDSLNQPIHNLNYNAVPYQIVGRVRAISNGLVYSVGLAIAGLLLWVSKSLLTPFQIACVGLGIAVIFLIARYLMGQSYLRSLLTLLRSGTIQLEQVSEGLTRLPAQYRPQIRALLTSRDRLEQNLGVELARRTEHPSQFLDEIDRLLPEADRVLERTLLKFFATTPDPAINRYLRDRLARSPQPIQRLALIALIARKEPLEDSELRALCQSCDPVLKALTYIALEQANSTDPVLKANYGLYWLSNLDSATTRVLIESIRGTGDRKYIPLLKLLVVEGPLEVKRQALEALALFVRPGDRDLAELAATELAHFDPLLRAAALKLLGIARHPDLLPHVARGLDHPNLAVRLWAAKSLAAYGESGLALAEERLQSPRTEVVEAAIAAIGQVGTRRAETLLFNHLKPYYTLVQSSLRWKQLLPERKRWQLLRIAIQDFQDRLIHRVLYVLSNLDREGTSSTIRRILHTSNLRLKANALETLASGRYRRFVVPILPLLEPENEGGELGGAAANVLAETSKTSDRWIRLASSLAAGKGLPPDWVWPTVLDLDGLPLVPEGDELFLKRTLFLKTVPLFEPLFLDELLLANRALQCETFAAGEILCQQGTMGRGLYIVWRGEVELVQEGGSDVKGARIAMRSPKETSVESALSVLDKAEIETRTAIGLKPSQYFGEMTLLDDVALPFSAIARSDCTILTLSRSEFSPLINLYPRLLMGLSLAGGGFPLFSRHS